jgi:hypothetical protein
MNDESPPEPTVFDLAVLIDQELEAEGVEVVEDDVDSLRVREASLIRVIADAKRQAVRFVVAWAR